MLYVVGIGAGNKEGMTIEGYNAIDKSELVIGYTVYTKLVEKIFPDKAILHTGMGSEVERVKLALEHAQSKTVSLVCSGDSTLYAMASLVYELAVNYDNVAITVVAGVTAALSGGAILGAPLTNDFAIISLSDLITPWEKIEKRLIGAAIADFSIVLYNPSSKKRSDYLEKACDIILRHKDKNTVCGYVKNIGRDGEEHGIMTLDELKSYKADMFTTIFIGNSDTIVLNGKMITPRGYKNG